MSEAIAKNHPVRSMTGYARIRRETPLGELTVSLRSVPEFGSCFTVEIPLLTEQGEAAAADIAAAESGKV